MITLDELSDRAVEAQRNAARANDYLPWPQALASAWAEYAKHVFSPDASRSRRSFLMPRCTICREPMWSERHYV